MTDNYNSICGKDRIMYSGNANSNQITDSSSTNRSNPNSSEEIKGCSSIPKGLNTKIISLAEQYKRKDLRKNLFQGHNPIDLNSTKIIILDVVSFNSSYYLFYLEKNGRFINSEDRVKVDEIDNKDQKTIQLNFNLRGSLEKYALLRQWLRAPSEQTDQISNEDSQQWAYDQVENYARMKIAGVNSHFFPPLDFYIVTNESKTFYFADTLFEVDGIPLAKFPLNHYNNHMILLIFDRLLNAFFYLKENDMHLIKTNAVNVYIQETGAENVNLAFNDRQVIVDVKIIPQGLENNPKVQNKDKFTIANIAGWVFGPKKDLNREIKCNFDPFLKELILAYIQILEKINESSQIGNGNIKKNPRSGSVDSNNPKLKESSEINKMLETVKREKDINFKNLKQMSDLTKNMLNNENNFKIDYSLKSSNDMEKPSFEEGHPTDGGIPPQSEVPETLLNHTSPPNSQHYIVVHEEKKTVMDVGNPKFEYLNDPISLSIVNSSEKSKNEIHESLKTFHNDLFNNLNKMHSLNQIMEKLENSLIDCVDKKRKTEAIKCPVDPLAEKWMKLNAKFDQFKKMISCWNNLKYTVKTEQIFKDNSVSWSKITYIIDQIPSFPENKFCIVADYQGDFYLGEYDVVANEIILKGFGLRVSFNDSKKNENMLYLGEFSDSMKNGFGYEPNNLGAFIGIYKNNKEDGYRIFFNQNKEFTGGIYSDGTLTAFRIKGNSKSIYKGEMKNNMPHGKGTQKLYENGNKYIGMFSEGKKEGYGRETYPKQGYYEGHFQEDIFNGYGERIFSETNYFKGNFKDGKFQEGIKVNGDEIYEGEFLNNLYDATGRLQTNEFTQGQWESGIKEGMGTLKSKTNNSFYEGIFKNDQFVQGEYVDEYGNKFKGTFNSGEIIGNCEYFGVNGERYYGEIQNYKFHGSGCLTDISNNTFQGTWKYGKLVGPFTFTHLSGIKIQTEYIKDVISGKVTIVYPEPTGTIYIFYCSRKTHAEIIEPFIDPDSEICRPKEDPTLNGDYKIKYSNGDEIEGTFHLGLLSNGVAKIIILGENNIEGKNLHKHCSIINRPFFHQCKYHGQIRNGQFDGKGKLIYENLEKLKQKFKDHIHISAEINDLLDNQEYEDVIWQSNSIKTANNTLIILRDSFYYGGVKDNKYQGQGQQYFYNGEYENGTFYNGKFVSGSKRKFLSDFTTIFDGKYIAATLPGTHPTQVIPIKGNLINPKYTYNGDVSPNYILQGKGILTYTIVALRDYIKLNPRSDELENFFLNHSSIEGTFANNEIINGDGTYIFKEGLYNGSIINQKRTGYGSMYFPNGDSYTGNWFNNLFHSQGEFTTQINNKFIGNWVNGFLPGAPIYLLSLKNQ